MATQKELGLCKQKIPPDLIPLMLKEVEYTHNNLGGGSFGTVEEVIISGAVCACKKLHNVLVDPQNEGVARISNQYTSECRLMSSIRHPNIVQFLGFCDHPTSKYPALVMERLTCSVDDLLMRAEKESHTIPFSLKTSILTDTLKGLVFLHDHDPSVVHRDLTARNILLTPSMEAKIADFGNALVIDQETLHKTLTRMPGTAVYMPPEAMAYYSTKQTTKVDIFSFGHLALYIIIQKFPEKLLRPTYRPTNEYRLLGRTEIQRRDPYINTLYKAIGENHLVSVIIRECLSDSPEDRSTADMLLKRMQGAPEYMLYETNDVYYEFSSLHKLELIQQMQNPGRKMSCKEKRAKQDVVHTLPSMSQAATPGPTMISTRESFTGDLYYTEMNPAAQQTLNFKSGVPGHLEFSKVSKFRRSTGHKKKKYTFQILDDTLTYYEKPNLKGTIKLDDVVKVTVLPNQSHGAKDTYKYRFEVVCKVGKEQTSYRLGAQSEEERSSWIQAISSKLSVAPDLTNSDEYDDVFSVSKEIDHSSQFQPRISRKNASESQYTRNIAYNTNTMDRLASDASTFTHHDKRQTPRPRPFVPVQSSPALFKGAYEKEVGWYEIVDPPTKETGRQTERTLGVNTKHGNSPISTTTDSEEYAYAADSPTSKVIPIPVTHQFEYRQEGQKHSTVHRSSSFSGVPKHHKPPKLPPKQQRDDKVGGPITSYHVLPAEQPMQPLERLQRRHTVKPVNPTAVHGNLSVKIEGHSPQRVLFARGDREHSHGNKHAIHVQHGRKGSDSILVTSPRPGQYKDGRHPLTFLQKQASNLFLPSSALCDLQEIGTGFFGRVYKATLKQSKRDYSPHSSSTSESQSAGFTAVTVAVKEIKEYISEQETQDFHREMDMMKDMIHPNIIQLYGIVQEDPPRLVLEYLPKGDLKKHLSNNKRQVGSLVQYMFDVSLGMNYLQERGLVHRDLAARNIMVAENETCKVADFGLLREIPKDDTIYLATQEVPLPIRWMAPESLDKREFSSASDVWSFGVLCWEMYYPTETPYGKFDNMQYGLKVSKGYRLTIPTAYPSTVSKIMEGCWQLTPEDRPDFALISSNLKMLLIHGDNYC